MDSEFGIFSGIRQSRIGRILRYIVLFSLVSIGKGVKAGTGAVGFFCCDIRKCAGVFNCERIVSEIRSRDFGTLSF